MSDLTELFARDPLHYTDQDLTIIVGVMRENQAQYELGIKAPKAAAKPKSTKTDDLLKDLGLM